MNRLIAVTIVGVLYAFHQDFWLWREARPLVFGVLPVGLFYHAAFTMVTVLALLWLVHLIWPSHLDSSGPSPE